MSTSIEGKRIAPAMPVEGGFTPLDAPVAPPAVSDPNQILPDALSRIAADYHDLIQDDTTVPTSDVTFAALEFPRKPTTAFQLAEKRGDTLAAATDELIDRAVLFQPSNAAELVDAALTRRGRHIVRAERVADLHHRQSTVGETQKPQYYAPLNEGRREFNERSKDGLPVTRRVQAAQAIGKVAEIHGRSPLPETQELLALAEEMAGGLALDRHLPTGLLNGRSKQLGQGYLHGKQSYKGLFGIELSRKRSLEKWDPNNDELLDD
jgi:hypothetical protein